MRILHHIATAMVTTKILWRHTDCNHCGGCIWSGMQAHLRIVKGKTQGWYCSEECLEESRPKPTVA